MSYASKDVRLKFAEKPDLMVCLSHLWIGETTTILVSGLDVPTPRPAVPTIQVDWTDGAGITQKSLQWLVTVILKYLEAGNRVEIACTGGHGRTGTLLATLLGIVEDLPADKAIEELRARYCEEAVETIAQVRTVFDFLGYDLTSPKIVNKVFDLATSKASALYFGGYDCD